MGYQDLLFELGAEELPPKVLKELSLSLENSVKKSLDAANLSYEKIQSFASPRRLALIIPTLQDAQDDKKVERLGPAITAAYNDEDGTPTPAALGFARSCGVELEALTTVETPKGNRLAHSFEQKGESILTLIPEILEQALKALPIPKVMRWGAGDIQFVRPVHWVVLMYGEKVIPVKILGKQTGNTSQGHRFHAPKAIEIHGAASYEQQLEDEGHIIVNDVKRKEMIVSQSQMAAKKYLAEVVMEPALLDEVNAIVEYPYALCCEFPKDFLRVPQEALISSMQEHQKCFPLLNNGKKLLNHFITVSNIKCTNPKTIIKGNTKVMNARLSDAAFFYDTDLKTPLEKFVDRLENVTFHKKLGSLADKSKRVARLAGKIAKAMDADVTHAKRAGLLSKADLMTDMVNEFPELQGIMGQYYALASKEHQDVANALNEQYMPRFSGDDLPNGKVAQSLALADKLDTLVGIFGIGLKPTGDKDPFALRRAAIGVLRILKEKKIAISIADLTEWAMAGYKENKFAKSTKSDVMTFMTERLKGIYKEEGVKPGEFDAVASVQPINILDFDKRIEAVRYFATMPAAENLAAANKRVRNLLEKNHITEQLVIDKSRLQESAEIALFEATEQSEQEINVLLKGHNYIEVLSHLAVLEKPVNSFFDHVMIMSGDLTVRRNRLALLQKLYQLFRQIADISKLSS